MFSTIPDEVKGTVFRKNRMGDHKLTYDEQITIFFWLSLTLELEVLFACMENKHEKMTYVTKFGPKPKIFEILVLYLR